MGASPDWGASHGHPLPLCSDALSHLEAAWGDHFGEVNVLWACLSLHPKATTLCDLDVEGFRAVMPGTAQSFLSPHDG